MSESIVIEVENRSELEALAHSRGYDTVQDYFLALVAAVSRRLARGCIRVLRHPLRPDVGDLKSSIIIRK